MCGRVQLEEIINIIYIVNNVFFGPVPPDDSYVPKGPLFYFFCLFVCLYVGNVFTARGWPCRLVFY